MAFDLSTLKFGNAFETARSLRTIADKLEDTADLRSDGAEIQPTAHRDFLTIHISAANT